MVLTWLGLLCMGLLATVLGFWSARRTASVVRAADLQKHVGLHPQRDGLLGPTQAFWCAVGNHALAAGDRVSVWVAGGGR